MGKPKPMAMLNKEKPKKKTEGAYSKKLHAGKTYSLSLSI